MVTLGNRRYLAALAIAAAIVLSVGVFVRSRLLRHDAPTQVAPPSEAFALQQLSQERQLRRMSAFFAERVAALAPLIEYRPVPRRSGGAPIPCSRPAPSARWSRSAHPSPIRSAPR